MKVLFITHQADRTGAPLFLLEVIKAFKKIKPDFSYHVITLRYGPLVREFSDLAKVWVIDRNDNNIFKRILYNKYTSLIKLKIIKRLVFDFVYVNTSCSYPFFYENISCNKAYLHVHELRAELNRCLEVIKTDDVELIGLDRVLCVTSFVKEELRRNYSFVPGQKFSIVEGFYTKVVERKRIDNKKLTITGCGSRSKRKGFDLFMSIASRFNDELNFIWIGGKKNLFTESLDLKNNNVMIIDTTDNVDRFYSLTDIFLLTSREDPFPLAVLEVSQYNVPIICFDKNNGVYPIIQQNDAGIVITYEDEEGIIKAINTFANNHKLRLQKGLNAKHAFNPYSVENQMRKIITLLKSDNIIG